MAKKENTKQPEAAVLDKKEMFLESPSGFAMPFPGDVQHDVEVSLPYGEQKHPYTGEMFHHTGIDFVCQNQPLFATATGSVIGLGQDGIHGNYIVVRYGKFEVKYGHISEAHVPYGAPVQAGQQIGRSGDFLHLGVLFKGQEIDPMQFITLVYTNLMTLAAMGIKGTPQLVDYGIEAKTDYDKDAPQVEEMLNRHFVEYLMAIMDGSYSPSRHVESSLRNVLRGAAERNYYFEEVPTIGNPLGLSSRSTPLVSKISNLLIGDFLAFEACRKGEYLPSWNEEQKKNFLIRFQPTVI